MIALFLLYGVLTGLMLGKTLGNASSAWVVSSWWSSGWLVQWCGAEQGCADFGRSRGHSVTECCFFLSKWLSWVQHSGEMASVPAAGLVEASLNLFAPGSTASTEWP